MGLFSKLMGEAKNAGVSLDSLKKAAQSVGGDIVSKINEAADQIASQERTDTSSAPTAPARSCPSSGFSWGEEMPDEENQYNFNGTYIEYFDKIFREEFPQYQLDVRKADNFKFTVFTFTNAGAPALVVELKSETSSAQRVKRECEAKGIPYLRFYYDHDGWWNTRAYVVSRVRAALGC